MFVHLRGRSTYSMLEGIGSIDAVLTRVSSLKQEAVAITDLYGVYGAIDFYKKSRNYHLKPLIGVELPYHPLASKLSGSKNKTTHGSVVLLAQSNFGYHNLLKIISHSYDGSLGLPCLDDENLGRFSQDLYVLIGGEESYSYLNYQDSHVFERYIDSLLSLVGKENIIVDISAQDYRKLPHLRAFNDTLITLASSYDFISVASNNFCYPLEEQKAVYETALSIKDNTRTYDKEARKVTGEHHIMSEEEIRQNLMTNGYSENQINLWIDNSSQIAQSIDIHIELNQSLFPDYIPSSATTELYDRYRDQLVE